MKKLQNKIAVVTGASRGLGRAAAVRFAEEGAQVILAGRSLTDLMTTSEELKSNGRESRVFACDVTDLGQVEDLGKFAIREFGRFDIWVNNAGMAGPYGATLHLDPGQFLGAFQINMLGAYHGSLVALRHFLHYGRGKLVNILGAGAKKPLPDQNAYGSSKTWIRTFTLALAAEYKNSGVGIFTFQPGLMDTDLLTEIVTFPEYEDRLRRFMPLLIRAAAKKPEDVTGKLSSLVSEATDGRTGLEVDLGSRLAFMAGFLREGLKTILHLPVRDVPLNVKIIQSSFSPLK